MRQQVAFGPNLGSQDLPQLFTESNLWQTTYDRISAFQLYVGHIIEPGSAFVQPNTWDVLVGAGTFRKLREAGILLELQMAGESVDQVTECADKIASTGGQLGAICFDHAFEQTTPEQFAARIQDIRARYPAMIVGVYAPFPFKSLEQIRQRLVDWDRLGGRPDFVRLDYGGRRKLDGTDEWTTATHRALYDMCFERGLPLQCVINAREGISDGQYVIEATAFYDHMASTGPWHAMMVQSWASTPDAEHRYLPHNLPEIDASAHTALVRTVLERFVPAEAPPPWRQTAPTVTRPLVGQLRLYGKSYGDDSGPRRVLFCSWFPALRIYRDDPAAAQAQLDRIAAAGWQGVRIFTAVGRRPFWAGREVVPITVTQEDGSVDVGWPDYDDVVFNFFADCWTRGLRLHLTTGDTQIMLPRREDKIAHAQRIAGLVNGVSPQLVALHENVNEGFQNGYPEDDMNLHAAVSDAFNVICPIPLCGNSAGFGDPEDPAVLDRLSVGADVAIVHGTRAPADVAAARAFGLVYWEGDPHHYPKPFWQGEPTGPDGSSPEVYIPTNNPEQCLAIYASQQMTGQASNFFNGPAVRYFEPLDVTWGFTELPALMANIPEDVGQWPHVSHGNKSSTPIGAVRFADAGSGPARVDQVWNDEQIVCIVHGGSGAWELVQRRAMAWRMFDGHGLVAEGSGAFPPLDASMKARLIVGVFA